MFLATDVLSTFSKSTGHNLPVEELVLPADFKWGTAGGIIADRRRRPSRRQRKVDMGQDFNHLEPSQTNKRESGCRMRPLQSMGRGCPVDITTRRGRIPLHQSHGRALSPRGSKDPIYMKGIMFYSNLIDRLIPKGIEPV